MKNKITVAIATIGAVCAAGFLFLSPKLKADQPARSAVDVVMLYAEEGYVAGNAANAYVYNSSVSRPELAVPTNMPLAAVLSLYLSEGFRIVDTDHSWHFILTR